MLVGPRALARNGSANVETIGALAMGAMVSVGRIRGLKLRWINDQV